MEQVLLHHLAGQAERPQGGRDSPTTAAIAIALVVPLTDLETPPKAEVARLPDPAVVGSHHADWNTRDGNLEIDERQTGVADLGAVDLIDAFSYRYVPVDVCDGQQNPVEAIFQQCRVEPSEHAIDDRRSTRSDHRARNGINPVQLQAVSEQMRVGCSPDDIDRQCDDRCFVWSTDTGSGNVSVTRNRVRAVAVLVDAIAWNVARARMNTRAAVVTIPLIGRQTIVIVVEVPNRTAKRH